jgi:2-polyprenyl-3-methyl-5-hydroxy-6-metoxy-1,4-benzoquinol methylase
VTPSLVELLVCPHSGEPLILCDAIEQEGDIVSGTLRTASSGHSYPIVGGIPRFANDEYAHNFALEWTIHHNTQLDTESLTQSRDRLIAETGFSESELAGKLVLDAGCGAGRFALVAARAGARVIAVDLSEAVQICRRNCLTTGVVDVVQADLRNLPFRPGTFDFVYCIGVLQHTPEPMQTLSALARLVSRHGRLGLWAYERTIVALLHPKYLLRPLLGRLDPPMLYTFVRWYVPKLLPLARLLARFGAPRGVIERLIPVAFRDDITGISNERATDWSILDTYDWFSPQYDRPLTWKAVRRLLAAEFSEVRRTTSVGLGVHAARH